MKDKYPPSLLVSIVGGLLLSSLFVGIMITMHLEAALIVVPTLIFLFSSIVLILLVLEVLVYRKLKYYYRENELEIGKLKEMETFRREFIGDVSHELKTPIFAIQGFIETLLEGAIHDEKVNERFLQKALRHSERLSSLVEDILIITQIESGDIGMVPEPFDMEALVLEVLDSLAYKFIKKGRDIKYNVKKLNLVSCKVEADKERIDQVLRNLIDNAVKYGEPQGTIFIELESTAEGKLITSVKDEGQGIDPKHLPRLFERFYRVDKSRSRDKGGTGLGLAICKHLIEAHHEKIWVKSEVGKGTIFKFSLKKAS